MQKLPRLISFILFLLLCASLTYWAILFFSPPPRPVVAASKQAVPLPAATVAADLFGGKGEPNGNATLQLRGVILAGRAEESVAILVPEDGKPHYVRAHAELMPGVTVQQITAKKVVLSAHGVMQEVSLAPFAPAKATAGAPNAAVNMLPAQAAAVPPATGNSNEAGAPQGSNSAGSGSAGVTASGGVQNAQARAAAPANAIAVPQAVPNPNPAPPRQSQQ